MLVTITLPYFIWQELFLTHNFYQKISKHLFLSAMQTTMLAKSVLKKLIYLHVTVSHKTLNELLKNSHYKIFHVKVMEQEATPWLSKDSLTREHNHDYQKFSQNDPTHSHPAHSKSNKSITFSNHDHNTPSPVLSPPKQVFNANKPYPTVAMASSTDALSHHKEQKNVIQIVYWHQIVTMIVHYQTKQQPIK